MEMNKDYTRYLPMIFGTALVLYSAPMLMKSFLLLAGGSTLARLERGDQARPESLGILERSREMAASVIETGSSWNQLSLALVHQANLYEPGSAEQTEKLERAREAQGKGLGLQPANPHSWLRLAYINQRLDAPQKTAAALYMSYWTGPYEIHLAEYRLAMSAGMWQQLDNWTMMAVHAEVRLLNSQKPGSLKFLMENDDNVRNIAQQAL
ncbi:MAG: hypothetical protein OEZ32_01200 [Nitrospinota bacterium]|nr:hypothetical protein [Nitrospinota bacterium]